MGTKRFAAFIILPLLLPLLSGCDNFALSDVLYRSTELALGIHPAAAALRPGSTVTFTGVGGAPEYEYRVVEPGGGTIDPTTGDYQAPSTEGQFTVEVVDRAGDTGIGFVFVAAAKELAISPTRMIIEIGKDDSGQFTAEGGTEPYTFNFEDGGDGIGEIDEQNGIFTPHGENTGSGTVTLTDGRGSSVEGRVYVVEDGEVTLTAERNPIQQLEIVELMVWPERTDDHSYDFVEVEHDPHTESVDPPGTISGDHFEASDYIGVVAIGLFDGDTEDEPLDTLHLTVRAAAPTNFTATGDTGSNQTIDLAWSHGHDGHDGFRIERSIDGGEFIEIAGPDRVGPDDRTFTDTRLTPNTLYEYRVYATAGENRKYDSSPTPSRIAVSNQ